MEKFYHIRKREKENRIKTKSTTNLYKSIHSTRLEHEGTSHDRIQRECK